MTRLFKGQIFLGNGERSERLVDILRQRFEDAIVILGDEQQMRIEFEEFLNGKKS